MQTAQILTFPAPAGRRPLLGLRPAALADPVLGADEDAVAGLLVALEAAPLSPPTITVQHGLDRIGRVLVRLPSTAALLSPAQARLAADALYAENAFPACIEVALDLRQAADAAEMSAPYRAERPFRSSAATLLGLAALLTLAAATAVIPYH